MVFSNVAFSKKIAGHEEQEDESGGQKTFHHRFLSILVNYFTGHAHKNMVSKFGPPGKTDFLQAHTAGKGALAHAFNGIGQINFLEAAAVEEGAFINGGKTMGNIYIFQEHTVKKGPAAYAYKGSRQGNRLKEGTARKGPFVDRAYPNGNGHHFNLSPGKRPLPDTAYSKTRGYYRHPAEAPVLDQDPVFYLKTGSRILSERRRQERKGELKAQKTKRQKDLFFHVCDHSISGE
jgi:hypothetical protein